MNKTTMGLVWHDCLTCPPTEAQNMNLVMTDGISVLNVAWIHGKFFYEDVPLAIDEQGLWWADLIQTTVGYFSNHTKPNLQNARSSRELKWFSASEPPKKPGYYLCYFRFEPTDQDIVCQNYYARSHWLSEHDRVTHWAYLPKPPV